MHKGDLSAKILERLRSSELWGQRTRESGKTISGLKCPECGRSDAWTYKDQPAPIICNHKNTCGARTSTRDIFPEIIQNLEKEFAPTKEDPSRPAREYLFARGISSKTLEGVRYVYRPNIRKSGSGGVLFHVGTDSDGKEVWNGRIFSPAPGVDKSHNEGRTAGQLWRHPKLEYEPDKPTFVVEGIIEALSLIEMGLQAVTPLSSGADPEKMDLKGLEGRLVIALNPDAAGGEGLEKWKRKYPKAEAAVPVKGDWNDFLNQAPRGKAREAFEAALPEMMCRAALLLSKSAEEYAQTWLDFYRFPPGLFAWRKKYYWGAFGKKDLEVRNVSNFTCHTDHYQLESSDGNPIYRYYLKVYPASGRPVECSVSGRDLSTPSALRAALLENARVMWKGNEAPTFALASLIAESPAPVVRQVHLLGYDRESGACVFRDYMIDCEGRYEEPNKQGFFKVSRREVIRAPEARGQRDLCVKPKRGVGPKRIYELINAAWPGNGPLALAFTVASWFVWSVKSELGFFPFLSLHGDTQTGKSQLVRRLNAMQGLDGEGLPMTKLNTGKGEIRDLAKKSGLMTALLEGNEVERMRFDIESLLTLYNAGNPLQVRAVKSNDLATRVVEFPGTLVFVQNKEPFRTKAQMERVISSRPFKSDDITAETSFAFKELLKIPVREMAWCYVYVMEDRKRIEKAWYGEYMRARDEIMEAVSDNRIAENHGLALGFHRIAENIFGAKNDLTGFVTALAKRKQRQCNHRQADEADEFFDALNDLSVEKQLQVADVSEGKLYVRLSEARKVLDGNGYKFYGPQLRQALRDHPAYLVSNINHRASWGAAVGLASSVERTWMFDTTKLGVDVR